MRKIGQRPKLRGYLFAVAAAAVYGGSQVLGKQIIADVPPLVASAFGLLFGMVLLGVITVPDMRHDLARSNGVPASAYGWAALAGLASSTGVIMMFLALSRAPVVVVSPIFAVNPLIAILLAQIFIRRLERLTWRTVIGAMLVVTGVAIIAIGRNI